MIKKAYSPWQYRFFLALISAFFFIKFFLVLISWWEPLPNIGERFAAASVLILCTHLISSYALFWSLLLLNCAWAYVFTSTNLEATPSFLFISLLLIPAMLLSLPKTKLVLAIKHKLKFQKTKRKTKKKDLSSPKSDTEIYYDNWSMPAWVFYFSQFLFLVSLSLYFLYINYAKEISSSSLLELSIMQIIFFVLVFNPLYLKPKTTKNKKTSIIFFDGICGFCNHCVNFFFREDYKHIFRFSTLQGKLAASLKLEKSREKAVLVLYDKNQMYKGAEAVLKICYNLGGFWRIIALCGYGLPKPLRKAIYKFIAHPKRRYNYFGELEKCRIPNKDEKKYFI